MEGAGQRSGGVHTHLRATFSTRYGPASRAPGFVQPCFSPIGAREHGPVSVLGELRFALWLLMKGVNVELWENVLVTLPEITRLDANPDVKLVASSTLSFAP